MKKIFAIVLAVILLMSLCACSNTETVNVDTVKTTTTNDFIIERHYTDSGDLFCTKEISLTTKLQTITYFYWQYDDHGRKTLLNTECITVDAEGIIVSRRWMPG